jgi:integrase
VARRFLTRAAARQHTLRHSHGSLLIAGGEPLANVSKRLGHANAATTLSIYTHAVPGSSATAKRWEELQGKRGEEKTQ